MNTAMYKKVVVWILPVMWVIVSIVGVTHADMVAYWKLDNGGGNIVKDSSGNGHDGVLKGAVKWATGRFSGAIDFNGDDCYVEVACDPNDPTFDMTDEITISVWIKVNRFDIAHQTIIAKGEGSWRICRSPINSNALEFGCGYYRNNPGVFGEININDGNWHHIVAVNNGYMQYLYVDGVPDAYWPVTNSQAVQKNNSSIMIGNNPERMGRYFNGLIDEVAIFSHALSVDAIKQLYEQGAASFIGISADDSRDVREENAIWPSTRASIANIRVGDDNAAEPIVAGMLADFPEHEHLDLAVINIARNYCKQKNYDKARELYRYIAENRFGDSHVLECQKESAILSIRLGDEIVSIDEVDKLLADFPGKANLPRAIITIADEYQKKWPGHSKAIELYQNVLKHWPEAECAIWAQKGLVVLHNYLGDEAATEAATNVLLSKYIEHKNASRAIASVANEYYASGKYDKARRYYRYVADHLALDYNVIWSQMQLALLDEKGGDQSAFQIAVDKLIPVCAGRAILSKVLFMMGERYYKEAMLQRNTGQTDQSQEGIIRALKVWQAVVERLPQYRLAGEACIYVGDCCRLLGEYDRAIEYYQKVVTDYPDFEYVWHAQFMSGRCFEKSKQAGLINEIEADEQIRNAYETVLADDPDCPAAKAAGNWLKRHKNR